MINTDASATAIRKPFLTTISSLHFSPRVDALLACSPFRQRTSTRDTT
jgi:hypothetical protein